MSSSASIASRRSSEDETSSSVSTSPSATDPSSLDLDKLTISSTPGSAPAPNPWRISPHRLTLSSCPCTSLSKRKIASLSTPSEYLQLNLDRFDMLLTRLCQISNIPRITQNVELVLRELRQRGYELFHFAGRVLTQNESGPNRRGVVVMLLIPDPDNQVVGHRLLAELLIQFRNADHTDKDKKGGRAWGDIENIASRYIDDPEDWVLIQPFEYFTNPNPSSNPGKIEYTIPDKKERKSWETIINDLLSRIRHLYSGLVVYAGNVIPAITRATRELKRDGMRVWGFEMELVYRKTTMDRYVRLIRIGLKTFPVGSPMGGSVSVNKLRKGESEEEIGAVVLLEIKEGRIKHAVVMYKDEWPVVHSYRDIIPAPNLDGLEGLIGRK